MSKVPNAGTGEIDAEALKKTTLSTEPNTESLNFTEFEQKQCTPAIRGNDLGMWKIFLELKLGEVIS